MLRSYKHLFFDLDHTLWDFEENSTHTLVQLYSEFDLKSYGIPDSDSFCQRFSQHNQTLWTKYQQGKLRRTELRWKRFWLTLIDFHLADRDLSDALNTRYVEILPTQTRLIPYAAEILSYCAGKYEVHLMTNGFDQTQRMKIQGAGIAQYFNQIITSELSNSMKPRPGIFEYALEQTGASTENCVMIGDALDIDILGASQAGWDQIYYNPSQIKHDRNPTMEIRDLRELFDIL